MEAVSLWSPRAAGLTRRCLEQTPLGPVPFALWCGGHRFGLPPSRPEQGGSRGSSAPGRERGPGVAACLEAALGRWTDTARHPESWLRTSLGSGLHARRNVASAASEGTKNPWKERALRTSYGVCILGGGATPRSRATCTAVAELLHLHGCGKEASRCVLRRRPVDWSGGLVHTVDPTGSCRSSVRSAARWRCGGPRARASRCILGPGVRSVHPVVRRGGRQRHGGHGRGDAVRLLSGDTSKGSCAIGK